MKPVSDVVALVCDTGGLFIPIARKLAETYKKVYYSSEWQESLPCINRAVIGDGFQDFDRVADPLDVISKIDLAVFPDCSHSALQAHFESLKIPVWGSHGGVELELNRPLFLRTLAKLGLDVPPYDEIKGIDGLEEHLRNAEDVYVKVSRYRGTCETKHFRSWDLDADWLYALRVKIGPAGSAMTFVVCNAIPNAVEIGLDTYCVDGKWPRTALHGIEAKDLGYLASVEKYDELPEELRVVQEAFSTLLAGHRYRNQVSVEVRVTDDSAYPIDFTARGGLPSTASQLELWENFSEIVWAGAHGELVEPNPVAQFSAEVAVHLKGEPGTWGVAEVPKELDQWLKLSGCCEINERVCFPPEPGGHDDHVGWLVAIGDSPAETLETLKGYIYMLPDGMEARIEALAETISAVVEESEKGVKSELRPIPDPAIIVENA